MNNFNFRRGSYLSKYLDRNSDNEISSAGISFYAALDQVKEIAPDTAKSILKEYYDQQTNLKLIASENFSSLAVQMAQGNLLTDKYAEGYPYHRFYAGCDNVDEIEANAAELACKLFGAEHAYVQPHSGSDANLLAFLMVLSAKVQYPIMEELEESNPSKINRDNWLKIREKMHNQRLMAMDYYSGGHLTHGYRHNFSSILFDVHNYTVNPENNLIDLDQLRKQLHEVKPLIFMAGYSSYPRKLNFAKMREMADEVGAVFIVDMSHFAGLVAGKVFQGDYNPVPHAHIVTTTTHKTLRGPRGGIILSNKEFAPWAEKGCPLVLGGPLPHVIAAKAVAFKEALSYDYKEYSHNIVKNSTSLAEACLEKGMKVITEGTDNHLMLIDVASSYGLTGRQAESVLRECNITLNRNVLPFDENGPWYTSGLRIGTPAITTLGMGKEEMKVIADTIKLVLENTSPALITKGENKGKKSKARYILDDSIKEKANEMVSELLGNYPLYPELDFSLVKELIR
ncbi:MAG: glycine hydroxymethyltransferase [Halanaerobiales bacterium]